MRSMEITQLLRLFPADPLAILKQLQGYYLCPRDSEDKPLGPLVGYAGIYAPGKHYVGFEYANFAKAEKNPVVLEYFARLMHDQLQGLLEDVIFCGAPMGGICFASQLGLVYQRPSIYPEKEVVQVRSASSREESELVFKRHEIEPGGRYFVVEDVTNNFSTTAKLFQLIMSQGGQVAGIISLLNRSFPQQTTYRYNDCDYPVVSLVTKSIPEYRQDAPEVAALVGAGKVVWKPKNEWSRLDEAMI